MQLYLLLNRIEGFLPPTDLPRCGVISKSGEIRHFGQKWPILGIFQGPQMGTRKPGGPVGRIFVATGRGYTLVPIDRSLQFVGAAGR